MSYMALVSELYVEAVEKGLSEKLREVEQKNGCSECAILNDLG